MEVQIKTMAEELTRLRAEIQNTAQVATNLKSVEANLSMSNSYCASGQVNTSGPTLSGANGGHTGANWSPTAPAGPSMSANGANGESGQVNWEALRESLGPIQRGAPSATAGPFPFANSSGPAVASASCTGSDNSKSPVKPTGAGDVFYRPDPWYQPKNAQTPNQPMSELPGIASRANGATAHSAAAQGAMGANLAMSSSYCA